jgi:hypothetical protein
VGFVVDKMDQLITTTEDPSTQSLDIPDWEHMANDQEEEGDETATTSTVSSP